MEREPMGRAGADTGQARQLCNEVVDRRGDHRPILPMRLVVPTPVRPASARALELGEPLASEVPHCVAQLGLGLEHLLEVGAVEREATDRRLREDSSAP